MFLHDNKYIHNRDKAINYPFGKKTAQRRILNAGTERQIVIDAHFEYHTLHLIILKLECLTVLHTAVNAKRRKNTIHLHSIFGKLKIITEINHKAYLYSDYITNISLLAYCFAHIETPTQKH